MQMCLKILCLFFWHVISITVAKEIYSIVLNANCDMTLLKTTMYVNQYPKNFSDIDISRFCLHWSHLVMSKFNLSIRHLVTLEWHKKKMLHQCSLLQNISRIHSEFLSFVCVDNWAVCDLRKFEINLISLYVSCAMN